ncbi:hypothetical protein SAMN05444354_11629 [Stigmatella aurantiaca]|uniref:Uncharacterized protein n=1 Tax=Stigmatella aurantiaca TaxID=41 RepID=A0A1H7Y169_STIAU|nr:hypothetical protein [Stigmatella aurantiaca]SEM39624.1 hypothetical protein SAMN05444354_11629 [Stigmatella aurantiaca]
MNTARPSPAPEPLPSGPSVPPELPSAGPARHRWAAGVAVAVLVLGVVGLDAGFRRSRLAKALAAESLYIHKGRTFDASPGADIGMTGDSRILHGFFPAVAADLLEEERGERLRVYNAGLSGAPPMAQLAWVRRFLSHPERRAKLVVMGISPYMFSSRIAWHPSRESLTTLWRLQDLVAAVRAGAGFEELSTITVSNLFEAVRLRPQVVQGVFHGRMPGSAADPGEDGYVRIASVDPYTQAARAQHRGMGYRTEMWKPEAHFGNEQMGYFEEALRELREEGIPTLIINTPSASQVEVAYGPNSLYDEHLAWVKAKAEQYGAKFADLKRVPGLQDADFVDGDHLSVAGAVKFTEYLTREHLLPMLGGPGAASAGCRPLFSFDTPGLPGWTLQGEAMADAVQTGPVPGQQPITGQRGSGFFNTFTAQGDTPVGEALSPPFLMEGSRLRLRVGGGGAGREVGVALLVEGREVARGHGQDAEHLGQVAWDVAGLRGQTAHLRIWDAASGGWGHILVDDVRICP